MNWQKAAAIAAVLAVIGGGTVAFFKYHATFALADQLQQVSTDFKYYRLSNQSAVLQQRMWQLKDRHKCEVNLMPQSSKEEYRRIEAERNAIERELNKLDPKGKQ